MHRLIPKLRGTGIVTKPTCKRSLELASVADCYVQSGGGTTMVMAVASDFLKATFATVSSFCVIRQTEAFIDSEFLQHLEELCIP